MQGIYSTDPGRQHCIQKNLEYIWQKHLFVSSFLSFIDTSLSTDHRLILDYKERYLFCSPETRRNYFFVVNFFLLCAVKSSFINCWSMFSSFSAIRSKEKKRDNTSWIFQFVLMAYQEWLIIEMTKILSIFLSKFTSTTNQYWWAYSFKWKTRSHCLSFYINLLMAHQW